MIKEIRLVNFLSFKDITLKFNKHQNILVGINGSGKSNLLKAIRILYEGVSGSGLRKYIIDNLGGLDNILFKHSEQSTKPTHVGIYITFNAASLQNFGFRFTDNVQYSIEFYKVPSNANYYVKERIVNDSGYVYLDFDNGTGVLNERTEILPVGKKTNLVRYTDFVEPTELALSKIYDTDRYYALSTIRKAVGEIVVYNYFDTTPRSNIRKPMLPTSEKRLICDGTNLPQILNTIKINYKSSYAKIVEMLNEVNPNFNGFDFNFIGGNIELMLEEKQLGSSIHVSSISDGTLRYLCLLAILYNPDRGALVCIDEPEVGLHPDMIANIGRSIIEAASDNLLLVSTHSENLLNSFEIEDIRIFEKDEQNATQISNYSKSDFEDWYDEFSTGKMWRNGDLGGNRW